MAWQTPKTNWGVDPVGPGDFNRIEGNIKYLKEQADNIVSIYEPSDDVVIEALPRQSGTVRNFRVLNPGRYRITGELNYSGGVSVNDQELTWDYTGSAYRAFSIDLFYGVPAWGQINILARRFQGDAVSFRNIRIRGKATISL